MDYKFNVTAKNKTEKSMHTIDKQDMNHLMREANKLFMK